MKNVLIMVGLLLAGFSLALLAGLNNARAGQLAIALVFAFTALGHFIKQDEMMAMLPPALPARRAAVLLSGVVELIFVDWHSLSPADASCRYRDLRISRGGHPGKHLFGAETREFRRPRSRSKSISGRESRFRFC